MYYVISNGKTYIKLNGNGNPETCSKKDAQVFSYEKANNLLNNIPKTMKKFHFTVRPHSLEKNQVKNELDYDNDMDVDIVEKNLKDECSNECFHDDYMNDEFEDTIDCKEQEIIKKQHNDYVYTGITYIEKLDNVLESLKDVISFISDLDRYVENMKYEQKEIELKIQDMRHYIRNNNTKLDSVKMGKFGYHLQELERERAIIKLNRTCCSVINNDICKLRDSSYIKKIDSIIQNFNSYNYRRIDENEINEMIGKKKSLKENWHGTM